MRTIISKPIIINSYSQFCIYMNIYEVICSQTDLKVAFLSLGQGVNGGTLLSIAVHGNEVGGVVDKHGRLAATDDIDSHLGRRTLLRA